MVRLFHAVSPRLRIALISSLILAVVLPSVFLYPNQAYSASYTFAQTDWQGGTDGGSVAAHPGNQTGWTTYSAIASLSGTVSAGNVVFPSTSYTATDSGTFSSTGAATGGGFSSGTVSSTQVNGSGSTATVTLSGTAFASPWSTLTAVPATIAACECTLMSRGGTEDYVYIMRSSSTTFYRYSISGNSYSTMTALPATTGNGAFIMRNGTDNDIYILTGGNGTGFYKYSISGNSYTTLTAVPSGVGRGAMMIRNGSDNDIYVFPGSTGVGSTAFYKYSISGNSWTTLAVLPAAGGNGSRMVRDGSSNDIYLTRGNGNTSFYKYSISGDSWTTLAVVPANVQSGAQMIRNGSDNDIYVATAGGNTGFYKYSISGDSWTTLTALPTAMNEGGTLLRSGSSDTIYVSPGNGATTFYKYSVAGNSFVAQTVSPGAINSGGMAIWNTSENAIYVLGGGSGTGFYKFDLATTPWTSLNTTPGNTGTGSMMIRNGSDDEIYAAQGANATGFYKYTISSGSWSSLTAVPGSVGSGGYLLRDGSSNDIYVIRGGNTANLYKYSISGNSWTTLTSAPGNIFTGGYAIRNGSDDHIYVLAGNGATAFYRYSISGNSWTSLTVLPGGAGGGASMIRDGSSDDIYILRAGFSTGFYKYSISGNSYTTLTVLPALALDGPPMFRSGSSNDIYIFAGNTSGNFYKYSISGNSYTTLTSIPANLRYGTAVRNGSDDEIYVAVANSTNNFYRYSISGNSWTTLQFAPATSGSSGGAFLMRATNENDIFFLSGNNSNGFHRYAITGNYATSGTFTSATIDTHGVLTYGNISWTNTTKPSGATMTLATRSSTDGAAWGSWSSEYSTSSGTAITSTANRYIQYRATYATNDVNVSPVLASPIINYTAYPTSGTLISSIYNSGDAANIIGGLVWTEDSTLPSGTAVTISLRAATTSGGVSGASWSDFTNATSNCSKSSGTVTCTSAAIPGALQSNAQYFQYKIAQTSSNGANTPTVGSVTVSYVVNAAPQIQNVTATQNSNGTVTIGYEVRDSDTTSGTTTPGYITPSFEYWNGASYSAATTFAAGDTSNKAVNADGSTWTAYTATWTAATDFAAQYLNNTAKIRVTANDNEAANNTANAESATFTLDTKVPASASVVADYSGATAANSYQVALTLAATDDSSMTMMISTTSNHASPLFSGAYAASKNVNISNTPDSPPTMYVRFTDAKGNITNVSTTPPARATNVIIQDISNTSVSPAEYRLFTAWKAVSPTGFGSYKVYRSTDQSSWSLLTTIASASTNYYTDATPSANTTYYYRLTILNSNGDTSFVSATVNGTANGTQDGGEGSGGTAIAPTISSVTVSNITPTTATVTWDTDQISNSAVSYSTTAGLFNTTTTVASMVDTAAGVGQHSVVLSGLSPNTTYYLRASSTNTTGSTGTASNGGNGYSFTTLSGPAITSTGTARIEAITNTTAMIIWTTSTASDSRVTYSTSPTFTSSSSTTVATLVTNHEVTVSGLTANTKYFFYVQSTDGSGNVEQDKNVVDGVARYYSFTTTNDSTAPTISSTSAVAQSTTAVILWTTDEPATSQVEYGTTESYGTTTSLDSTLTTQHSVSLSGLSSGTTYHYRVKTMDADSNLRTGSDNTFTTGDTTAPTISSVTSGSIALTAATITWTTNEQSSSIVEYGTSISYGSTAGSETEAVTAHSVTLANLSANTLYYYRVRSRDASGNLATSDNSGNGYTFTTSADTTAPTISSVTTSLVSDTSAVITWTTNEIADSRVDYGLTTGYGSFTDSATDTTTHTITITGLTKSTPYFYKVTSIDPSGNSTVNDNSSAGHTFTTTAEPRTGGGGSGGAPYIPPPNITDVQVSNITKSSVRISWKTDKEANSIVSFNAPGGPLLIDGNADAQTIDHVVDVTGLDSGTTYTYRPTSYDPKGARTLGEAGKFTTLSADGKLIAPPELPKSSTPPPTNTLPPGGDTKSSPVLEAIKSIVDGPLFKTLPENTIITLLNEIAEKAISAPTIIGDKATVEVQGTTAIISWATDKKTIGMVAYGKEGEATNAKNTFSIAGDINTYNTTHKVTLDRLDPATTYRYEVQAKAAYGPEAKFASGSFRTTSELPVITDVQLSSINDNSVTVTWKTSTPTAASVEYTNRTTDTTLAQGDTSLLRDHAITIKDLDAGAPYSLVIKATDEFKNESVSPSVPFTTGKDEAAPEITKVTAESTIYPGKDSRVQTIITWTTSEPATSQVFYQDGVGTNAKEIELAKDTTLVSGHTSVVTRFAPASIYKFWVVSVDASGNVARSKDYTILTPQQKETVVDVILKNFEQTFGWTQKLKGGP